MNSDRIEELIAFHHATKEEIAGRLADFRRIWAAGSDEDLFAELAFCLLTPQSRARVCWPAVERLRGCGLLFCGTAGEVEGELERVRFAETKAGRIVAARRQFTRNGRLAIRAVLEGFADPRAAREWLVGNVSGLGYKEAGHFLRNIGLAEELAIIYRHILMKLALLGVADRFRNSSQRCWIWQSVKV